MSTPQPQQRMLLHFEEGLYFFQDMLGASLVGFQHTGERVTLYFIAGLQLELSPTQSKAFLISAGIEKPLVTVPPTGFKLPGPIKTQ